MESCGVSLVGRGNMLCKGPEAEQSSMTSRSKKNQCYCSIMNKEEGCQDESGETKPRFYRLCGQH